VRQIASKVSTPTTKNKEEDFLPSEERKKKSPLFIAIIIFIILFLVIAAVIRFNVGNLSEKYLRNFLENVPIISNLLPASKKDGNKYVNLTKEELIKEINNLESQLERKEEQLASYQNAIERLEAEVKRLREIEEQQLQFKLDKDEFSKQVAQDNPEAFMKFFESIYPDTAAQIYEELLGEEVNTQEIKKYAEPFQTMDPASAAEVVEEMMVTDMDLVVLIFNNIDSEQQAAIIEEMNPERAARLVKSLAPQ